MSNEELAVMIQAGRRELLLDLWAQTQRLAWRFLPRWRAAATAGGLTEEDLEQVSFLALLRAVDAFDAERGLKFSTYFITMLKAEVFNASGIRTEKRARDPLRYAVSLDVPLSQDAPEGSSLSELIPDPAAEEAIDGAGLRLAIRDFLAELPEPQRRALYEKYWLEISTDRKAHDAALKALRHPSRSRRLKELFGEQSPKF